MARTFGHWRLSSQTINFSVRIVNGIIHPSRSNQMKQKLGSRKTKSSEDIIHNKSVQGKYTLENEWHYTDEGHLGWKRSRKKERKMSPWPGREECVRPCSSLRHQLHVSEAAWQFHIFPRRKKNEEKYTFSSVLTLAAASWRGVNFQRSETFTVAPCLTNSSVTYTGPFHISSPYFIFHKTLV